MNMFATLNHLRRAAVCPPPYSVRNGANRSIIIFRSFSASTSSHVKVKGNGVDHFDILGVERTYAVPIDELKSRYKHLMKELHPDRYATAPKDVATQKAAMATNVTRAYSVIGDPLSRALHLLDLHGSPIQESNDQSLVDHDLLLEVMEIREQIENASTDDEMKPMFQSTVARKDELIGQLATAFRENRISDAKLLTAKLQYWTRIEETIVNKMTSVHK